MSGVWQRAVTPSSACCTLHAVWGVAGGRHTIKYLLYLHAVWGVAGGRHTIKYLLYLHAVWGVAGGCHTVKYLLYLHAVWGVAGGRHTIKYLLYLHAVWQCDGQDIGTAHTGLQIPLPAISSSYSDSGQVGHTNLPLSASSIISCMIS